MSAIALSYSTMPEGRDTTYRMFGGGMGLQPGLEFKVEFVVDAKTIFYFSTSPVDPPSGHKVIPTFVSAFPGAGGVSTGSSADVAAQLTLPGYVPA